MAEGTYGPFSNSPTTSIDQHHAPSFVMNSIPMDDRLVKLKERSIDCLFETFSALLLRGSDLFSCFCKLGKLCVALDGSRSKSMQDLVRVRGF